MSPNQVFFIEVIKLTIPVLTGVLSVAMAYLAYLKSREAVKSVGVVHEKQHELAAQQTELAENVNGKMQQLIEAKNEVAEARADAAAAKGELKGVTETTPHVVEAIKPLVNPPRNPHARTRREDQVGEAGNGAGCD